ncbi:12372_t:CDS:2 [Rhizophagus irregularis]|nr:12372_t:CDS:2 [Rhizophagus irregularis]
MINSVTSNFIGTKPVPKICRQVIFEDRLDGSLGYVWRKCEGLHNLYVTTYVIGDLSKEEAEEYFEKHILSQNASKFSVYISEYMKLKHSLHLKRLKYSDRPDRPLWTDSDLIKTIKALMKTES